MPRAAVGRWHRCVTVPIDCRSREASLLSKTSTLWAHWCVTPVTRCRVSSLRAAAVGDRSDAAAGPWTPGPARSEEHTSELQSQFHLVCRLLLEKKKLIDM